ncbi:MAG: EAL domain-containing protein [Spirochaetales bacterium]|nr:EAL domain-containing protein [Spirochaetales bacterium]
MQLSISSLIIGMSGYFVAKKELNKKGEQILKNAVIQAIDLLYSEYEKVESGIMTKQGSQEIIKETLLGIKDPDTNLRDLHGKIDLGKHGYFIIYDPHGNEIMHPSLEGENILETIFVDQKNRDLLQDQITVGLNGGGYTYYSWWLPYSTKVSKKISYSDYFSPWKWIVVATTYEVDLNRAANIILFVIFLTMASLISIVSVIILKYVKFMTTPIVAIVDGMGKIASKEYIKIKKDKHKDEIGRLVDGYNNMVESLQNTKEHLAEREKYISYLAFHDDLTGLPNRHAIEHHVSDSINQGCTSAYMLQTDILGLKIINSTLGFKQGDRLLQFIGSYFLELNDERLFLSRTSSNEFTIWIESVEHDEMVELVYDLRKSVKEHISKNGFGRIVDMHLAVSEYPKNGISFGELYEKTSIAMKIAKDTNNLRLNEYDKKFKEAMENELSMRRYLRKAIEENEIHPHYQAQVDYRSGRIVGVEALARWNSNALGAVSPSIFIPAIESQNLVTEFSHYMMDKILSDYPRLKEKYNDEITVSINISPVFFMDKGFQEVLNIKLQKHSIPPNKLTIEITEDVFISDFEEVTKTINHLHNIGVRVSIDDFGTGYSSLNYLTMIDFDEMKIDKSFINKIIEEPRSLELFKIFCQIAEIYNYDVVAEGVETEMQLEMIKTTLPIVIQGHLYAKPEPL